MCFWGNIKSFHSVKFRFTFTHVYIHALLNLKYSLISFSCLNLDSNKKKDDMVFHDIILLFP